MKFYLKYHWSGGKIALGLGTGQIRTLVSMATDNAHRFKMVKTVSAGCHFGTSFHFPDGIERFNAIPMEIFHLGKNIIHVFETTRPRAYIFCV